MMASAEKAEMSVCWELDRRSRPGKRKRVAKVGQKERFDLRYHHHHVIDPSPSTTDFPTVYIPFRDTHKAK